jgi:hypothetical protein
MTVSEWYVFLSEHNYTVKRNTYNGWDEVVTVMFVGNIRIDIELLDHNGVKYRRWIFIYKQSKTKDGNGNHFWTQEGFPVFPFFRVSDYTIVILIKSFFLMKKLSHHYRSQ